MHLIIQNLEVKIYVVRV